MGKAKYDILGYKRMILDYHFSQYVPETLSKASVKEIVEAMAYLGLDSLLLYAKDHWGNVYHSTNISHMHRNVQYDLFGQVLAGLREKGIKTIAYYTVCWDEWAARNHPEWTVKDKDGKPVKITSEIAKAIAPNWAARWTFLCINSPYRDFSFNQLRELVGKYDFPALFLDILGRFAVCYCPHCQKLWFTKHRRPIPEKMTVQDRMLYIEFQRESFNSYSEGVKKIIEESGKKIMTTHNAGFGYEYDDYVISETDPWGLDYYRPSALAKERRAYAAGREVELIAHRFNQMWDFTIKPVPLLKWEAATVLAHNCAFMIVDQPNLDGTLDKKAYEAMRESYKTVEELEPHIRNSEVLADIALLYSERNLELESMLDEGPFSVPISATDYFGAYKLLTEAHLPFDVMTEKQVEPYLLSKFKLLIVPNVVHISPEKIEVIKEYVKGGGNLFFCYRTATRDEWTKDLPQEAFGLLDIVTEGSYRPIFIKPAFDLHDTRVRINCEYCMVKAREGAEILGTVTNPCIVATEEKWVSHNIMPGEDTKEPAIVLGKDGAGHYIYINNSLFREYLQQDSISIRQLVLKLIERVYEPQILLEAPKGVEATYNTRGGKVKVFLVNGVMSKPCSTGSRIAFMAARMQMNLDEVIPISDVTLKVRGKEITRAENLAGQELVVNFEDGSFNITLPKLALYDVITLETKGYESYI